MLDMENFAKALKQKYSDKKRPNLITQQEIDQASESKELASKKHGVDDETFKLRKQSHDKLSKALKAKFSPKIVRKLLSTDKRTYPEKQ